MSLQGHAAGMQHSSCDKTAALHRHRGVSPRMQNVITGRPFNALCIMKHTYIITQKYSPHKNKSPSQSLPTQALQGFFL